MKRTILAGLLAAALLGCDSGRTLSWPGRGDEQGDWTILLCRLDDPMRHVDHASTYKQRLAEDLGWKGVFTINKGGHSEVYWGRYASPKHARADFKIARAHTTRAGTRPFAAARVVALPGRDIGPAKWNLKNVKAPYTLLVATFQDDPERNYRGRRKFAVGYCRRLREGGYDAYFHHRPSLSLVTIGAFGGDSIRVIDTPAGKKLEMLDAKIKILQRDFPNLQVNGNTVSKVVYQQGTGKRIALTEKTYLIPVQPDEGSNGL